MSQQFGETPFMFAAMRGAEIFVVATIETSNKSNAIVARKDRGITTERDLKAKNIGVTIGTTSDFLLDAILVLNGLTRKDVKVVDIKPEKIVEALLGGEVDAVTTWNPHLSRLKSGLGANGVTFYGETIYTETFCLAADKGFVHKSPEAVKKALRALVRAEQFVKQNPAESQALAADLTGTDKTLLADVWNVFDFTVKLDQALLITLEDESRWAIRNALVPQKNVPNYLSYIYLDGLKEVRPEAVRIIK